MSVPPKLQEVKKKLDILPVKYGEPLATRARSKKYVADRIAKYPSILPSDIDVSPRSEMVYKNYKRIQKERDDAEEMYHRIEGEERQRIEKLIPGNRSKYKDRNGLDSLAHHRLATQSNVVANLGILFVFLPTAPRFLPG